MRCFELNEAEIVIIRCALRDYHKRLTFQHRPLNQEAREAYLTYMKMVETLLRQHFQDMQP